VIPIHAGTIAAHAAAAGLSGAAIHIASLDADRAYVRVDAGAQIYPASMIKTPIAVAVASAVETGRLGWADRILVDAANMTPNDAPSPLMPGAAATVRELVELMLSRSDNVATNLLIDCVGRTTATSAVVDLGFPQTAIRRKLSGALPLIDDPAATGRNVHPAREACELFARIAAGDVPGAGLIGTALAAQYWNTKLSAGLDPGDQFAHKTGDTDEVSHDGGILTLASGERYALAVYTTLPSSDETDRRFAVFMRALRPLLCRTAAENRAR
jgi:beta-lactamase class A